MSTWHDYDGTDGVQSQMLKLSTLAISATMPAVVRAAIPSLAENRVIAVVPRSEVKKPTFFQILNVPINGHPRLSHRLGDLTDGLTFPFEFGNPIDGLAACISLRLFLCREVSGFCEDGLQILFDPSDGFVDLAKRSVRVNIGELVGLDRAPMQEKDARDLAIGESADQVSRGLPQVLEWESGYLIIVRQNPLLESSECVEDLSGRISTFASVVQWLPIGVQNRGLVCGWIGKSEASGESPLQHLDRLREQQKLPHDGRLVPDQ